MIELRLGLRARATRDLDAVFRAEFGTWLDRLDGAIRQPVGDFTLTRTEPEQIKQTNTGPENDRFRDLMDLLLLREVLADTDLPRVREACVRIFEARKKHSWPPTVTVYESWQTPYREMAREERFEIEEVEDAAALVTEMIAQIDSAR